jgi:hypothetical protein
VRVVAGARPMLEVLVNASDFCVQPMQTCPPGAPLIPNGPAAERAHPNGTMHCFPKFREWFCPRELSEHYAFGRRATLADVRPLVNLLHARFPPDGGRWARGWVRVNLSSASPTEVTADLRPLRGAPVFAVRYAWGQAVADPKNPGNAIPERICCEADPLAGIARPCDVAACPLMASGGLPAAPFLARVVHGRCKCLPPQRCDGGGDS